MKNDDLNRGTGRTTGLMLCALGNALLAHGDEVEFVDHWPHTYRAARDWKPHLAHMAELHGLNIAVRRKGARLFVRSLIQSKGTP